MKRSLRFLAAGAVAAALAVAPVSAVSAQEDDPSIAELAVAADLDLLVAAVTAAGLAENLADCSFGPVTVFAPTDDAFVAALDALGLTLEELVGNTELLTQVLLYHVVSGVVPASEVVASSSLTTLQGGTIAVDGTVLNGSVNIVLTDQFACNGVVHVIDGVLVPTLPEPEPEPTQPPTTPAPTQPPATPAPTQPAPTAPPSGQLPATGSTTSAGALAAIALLIGGAALIGVSRRRVDA